MKRASQLLVWSGVALLSLPLSAHAQRVPGAVVALAAMPVLAAVLALALGSVTRSWSIGAANLVLVGASVAGFVAAARHSASDLLNWAPIAVLALHLVAMGVLIAVRVIRRHARRDGP